MELLIDCLKALATGGVLCAIGQALIDRTALTPARILTELRRSRRNIGRRRPL